MKAFDRSCLYESYEGFTDGFSVDIKERLVMKVFSSRCLSESSGGFTLLRNIHRWLLRRCKGKVINESL